MLLPPTRQTYILWKLQLTRPSFITSLPHLHLYTHIPHCSIPSISVISISIRQRQHGQAQEGLVSRSDFLPTHAFHTQIADAYLHSVLLVIPRTTKPSIKTKAPAPLPPPVNSGMLPSCTQLRVPPLRVRDTKSTAYCVKSCKHHRSRHLCPSCIVSHWDLRNPGGDKYDDHRHGTTATTDASKAAQPSEYQYGKGEHTVIQQIT